MKFSYELEFNAFGPWHDGYINYKRLKKLIKDQRHDLEGAGIRPAPVAWQEFSEEVLSELTRVQAYFSDVNL